MEPYRDLGTYEGLSGFQGAVGKVVRVKHQLRELELRFKTFTESHPYRLSEKFELRPDKKLGDYSFVIESVSVPKREWGVLIGELVHNLRSGLDHAVYAAAERPDGQTQFPIFTQRSDWDKKAGPMIRSVPDNVAALITAVQPYQAPKGYDARGHVLAILNRLSNHDKHRLLHTAVIRLEGAAPGVRLIRDVGVIREIGAGFGTLEPGETFVVVTLEDFGPEPKLELYGDYTFGVAFSDPTGDDPILDGLRVFNALLEMYRVVNDLIVRMEFMCKP